ncbi:MAG: iron response transcriptional regulator IrrA [Rhodomicrobium sp.]
MNNQLWQEKLRLVKLRPTRHRLALAELLFRHGHRHVTAEKLHAEALGQGMRISVATIYNTLHQFVDAGLLREVAIRGEKSFFDTNTSDHYHFLFEKEGRLLDIPAQGFGIRNFPAVPDGHCITRIDVLVHVKRRR